jgi:DNA-binding transcriptional regulator YhcF (GntR family)
LRILTAAEQVAAHLRQALVRGTWGGRMPGGNQLAGLLGVGRNTVEAALQMLEDEGVLVARGAGRRRQVVLPEGQKSAPTLRVAVLPGEEADRRLDYIVELQHELVEAGHVAFYPERALLELGMNVRRVASMVGRTKADAWVVVGGSREVLEWFADGGRPAFALFGRRRQLRIAGVGPDKPPMYAEATRMLLELGHRRIVLLAREMRRLPVPGAGEQTFLDTLAAHGIDPGPYHLPDWENNPEGFQSRLESLFQVTPPTALIIDEVSLFNAAYHFLAGRGLRVPGDVSLVCTDASPDFDWCLPTVAHIRWDTRPVVRRIVRWAENVARGRTDLRQTLTPAEFVAGGTVGRMNFGH